MTITGDSLAEAIESVFGPDRRIRVHRRWIRVDGFFGRFRIPVDGGPCQRMHGSSAGLPVCVMPTGEEYEGGLIVSPDGEIKRLNRQAALIISKVHYLLHEEPPIHPMVRSSAIQAVADASFAHTATLTEIRSSVQRAISESILLAIGRIQLTQDILSHVQCDEESGGVMTGLILAEGALYVAHASLWRERARRRRAPSPPLQ